MLRVFITLKQILCHDFRWRSSDEWHQRQIPSRGNPCSPFAALEQDLKRYVDASLVPSNISTYSSGEKQFLKFCEHFQISQFRSQFPTPEKVLIYFAVHLGKTVKANTINIYLSAVRNLSIKHGPSLDLTSFIQSHYVLRGIKRV